MLEIGRNCWRIEDARRAALIVDAADYFRILRKAMLKAKSQILLIGWDFDTRICLDFAADDGAPAELGAFIGWLPKQRPDLQIHILKWDIGAIKLLGRGTTVLRLMRWAMDDQIHYKLDGAHPTGASHHQKIVVIDDALAFCGGIDTTGDRWDTREHRDNDEHRRRPTTRRRFHPWHDTSMAVDGDAAKALGDLARERWKCAGGEPIRSPSCVNDPWPEELTPDFTDVDVAIARTRGKYEKLREVREIEALFIDMIHGAKHFIYAENQYFASRVIAKAICERLQEKDGPEFVIVNPKSGQGWLDEKTMSPARARLLDQLRKADRYGRFRMLTPVTEGGDDIYVHSKTFIVDDEQFRVGSANFNNRSMGLDSECDLMIDGRRPANKGAGKAIAAIRTGLLAEHLGVSDDTIAAEFAKTNSLIKTVEKFAGGKGRGLLPFVPEDHGPVETKLAEAEALDPESAEDDFEPMTGSKLFRGLPFHAA